jgi:hypothetical protein
MSKKTKNNYYDFIANKNLYFIKLYFKFIIL